MIFNATTHDPCPRGPGLGRKMVRHSRTHTQQKKKKADENCMEFEFRENNRESIMCQSFENF